MKGIVEYLIAGLLSFVLLNGNARADNTDNIIDITIYGDSLTSGYQLQPEEAYPAKLERKLKHEGFTNVKVTNMSVPNATTSSGVDRMDSVLATRPDIVILELGTNDTLSGIPPAIIMGNLEKMIDRLHKSGVMVVLIGIKAPMNMGTAYVGQIDGWLAKIAHNDQVYYYPFVLEGIIGKGELNLADGLHPSAKGVEVMVDNMYPTIYGAVRAKYDQIRNQQQYQQQYQQQQQTIFEQGSPGR